MLILKKLAVWAAGCLVYILEQWMTFAGGIGEETWVKVVFGHWVREGAREELKELANWRGTGAWE
jgi:hypothetical protein